ARVTVVLRRAGSTPLQTVELGPGWTLGRWVRIPPGPAHDGPVRLVAEVGGARRESELPARRWPRATARIRVVDETGAPTGARGWYSGDVHIHPNLFAQSWITPRDVLEIVRAEDLNVSNLLVCNDPSGFMNDLSRFEGKPHALSGGRYVLYWNEEMRNLRVYG